MARHHSTGRGGGEGTSGSSRTETKNALIATAEESDELPIRLNPTESDL